MKRTLGRPTALAAVAVLATCGAGAGSAAAATHSPSPTSTTLSPGTHPVSTVPGPTKPHPVKGRLRLYLPDAFFINHEAVTVPDRALHLGGVVRPYMAGQWVTVRAFVGRRLIKSVKLRLKRSRTGAFGHFTETISSPSAGEVTVVVRHDRTTTMQGFLGQRGFAALDENVGFGSVGRFVELIQERLAALHLYIPQTGAYDTGTGLALDAYHRLLGWGTYQTLDGRTISFLLNGWGAFKVRFPGHGAHAEGDLSDQLLALINGSKVHWIFPISSGKPSTPTILGDFHVYSRVPGYLPDGMYYSDFFYSGYAIHGYNPAPDYPASHGCMRLPIVDAIPAFNWLNYGDWVDSYYT